MGQFGYFGKVPTRGDFLQEQLPGAFVDSWSEWQQAILSVSREQLGEEWADCYLTSPVWHFALSPGACGKQGMVGTLMPSIDQVGRHFFLTLAAEIHAPPVMYWHQRRWCNDTEEHIFKVLDDDNDIQIWGEAVKQATWLPEVSTDLPLIQQGAEQSQQWVLLSDDEMQANHLLHVTYREQFDRYCIWWTAGSARLPGCMLVTNGLPLVSQFAAMMDGNWSKWGW